ncbi:PREDICTED: antimicrobial peptide NK-lysin-like [Odobenus rosmarus divergens]|uniref:Antimicrobial peptide NK-lysin-like n=1 Tax=Odobenus rosmarus divergens TaxID=9708 RepID=A0A9B0M2M2_ODORO
MTSWALLLLASVLLATPGLTFSGLSLEDHDLSMADMYEEEQFFEILAEDASKEAVKQVMSTVCRKTLMRKMFCDEIVTKYLRAITQGILNDKSPQEICVKIRMCRPEIGTWYHPEDMMNQAGGMHTIPVKTS